MINYEPQSHIFVLTGDDYPWDIDFSKFSALGKRNSSNFGPGCTATEDDLYRPIRVGWHGERAVGWTIGGQMPNYAYKQNGIPNDFIETTSRGEQYTIDVKTTRTDKLWIVYKNEAGTVLPLKCDVYWGVKLLHESITKREAVMQIYGVIGREAVITYKPRRSPRGRHWNYEIPLVDLLPFDID